MIRWGAVLCLLATTVAAQETVRPVSRDVTPTIRPVARGAEAATIVFDTLRPIARPYLRPDLAYGASTLPQHRAEVGMFAFSPLALTQSQRPRPRPETIEAAARARRAARLRGQVCEDPAIQGEALGKLPGPGGCGIYSAVKVRSVAGVQLTPAARIDCVTARALKTWVTDGAIPAVGDTGGGVAGLRIIGSYSCRNRNSQRSGRLSEHANGRALDIAGIRLRSGREITVLTDWNKDGDGARLREMWRAACGPFGTVLGPEANRFHRDHFHFDTARYRRGSYCR
ncbi:extensin-like domain-containing protein [Yoonia sediminilitoris]|uniref:Extensin-like C-terminal domain-containing protein n=1 Tax=Yoonia sediminilitoris TaxID=1286148 RepID=A0A2T6K5D7_9RHOB|nr:extensin family protein [Yoonia sediminilitoris]PUB09880.1 hypothetical protein C8N45_12413 [Yoonia sediminilitoris]RCW89603.1 hypothetical protein DFP92_12413 [Yoonia sediminilitoris]